MAGIQIKLRMFLPGLGFTYLTNVLIFSTNNMWPIVKLGTQNLISIPIHLLVCYMCPSNVNIIAINSDPAQVLRIDCDAPIPTEQTTEQITATERTTEGTTNT